jgi:hypothetical protein
MADANALFEGRGEFLHVFHPHVIKERKNIEGVIDSKLHHDYEDRHIGYTSKPTKDVISALKSNGYSHENMGSDGHHFEKQGENGVEHRIQVKRHGFSDKVSNVQVEHHKYANPIKEDAVPVNNAGGGQVAGIGEGPQGEPGVSPKTRKKVILAKTILHRAELNKNVRRRDPQWWKDRD